MGVVVHLPQACGQLGRSLGRRCHSLPSKQVWSRTLSLLLSKDKNLPLPGLLGMHPHVKSKFSMICVNEEEESGKWEK